MTICWIDGEKPGIPWFLCEVVHNFGSEDLEQYIRGTRFNGMLFDVKLEKSAEEPDGEPAPELESGMALADLLALTSKHDAAKEAYDSLAQANPKSEVEAGLAELAWRDKNFEEAKKTGDCGIPEPAGCQARDDRGCAVDRVSI